MPALSPVATGHAPHNRQVAVCGRPVPSDERPRALWFSPEPGTGRGAAGMRQPDIPLHESGRTWSEQKKRRRAQPSDPLDLAAEAQQSSDAGAGVFVKTATTRLCTWHSRGRLNDPNGLVFDGKRYQCLLPVLPPVTPERANIGATPSVRT